MKALRDLRDLRNLRSTGSLVDEQNHGPTVGKSLPYMHQQSKLSAFSSANRNGGAQDFPARLLQQSSSLRPLDGRRNWSKFMLKQYIQLSDQLGCKPNKTFISALKKISSGHVRTIYSHMWFLHSCVILHALFV